MKSKLKLTVKDLKHPVNFFAFGFGSGLYPKAPGTMGTIASIPIYYLLLTQLSILNYGIFLVATFILGIYICKKSSELLGVHDHGGIVWDEFVGFWLTMFMIPVEWYWIILGFILFRIFDILKPWPISWLDKNCEAGFGIMIDDVLAGIMASGCLHFIVFVAN